MLSKTVLYLSAFVLLCVPACESKKTAGKPAGNILAKVNGAVITEDDRYLLLGEAHGGAATPEKRTRILEELIDQELLYQKGLAIGLDKDAKYQNAVRVMEVRLQAFKRAEIARRVASTQIAPTVNVTDEDVNRYIEMNAGRLRTGFHLGIIRFTEASEAQESLRKIRNGEAFEDAARKRYPHVRRAGRAPWDLGQLRWYQVPVQWQETVERLGNGEVSAVLGDERNGYSILKLFDRKDDPRADLGSMRAGIMKQLRDQKLAKAYDEYISTLSRKAKIIHYEERGQSLE